MLKQLYNFPILCISLDFKEFPVNNMPSSKTRIAIIGGGVAGLVVARHTTAKLDTYSVTLFEQTDQVGGTWIYTDEIDVDKHGLPIHSSMYKNLR